MFNLELGYILILLLICIFLYKFSTRNFDHWRNKGIPYAKPLPFIGNFLEVFTLRSTIGHHLAKLYSTFDGPYFGIYVLNEPCLVLKDLDIIKSVLVTDFNHFYDRSVACNEKSDPIIAHALAFTRNPEWKKVRTRVNPVFSIGKIKNMVELISDTSEEMITYIKNHINKYDLEVKELCSKFAIDVIATCAFGVKAHCFENENAEFRNIGKIMFDFNWRNGFTQACYFMAPGLVELFKLPFFDPRVNEFSRKVFWKVLEERKRTNAKRNDVIDVINQIREGDSFDDDLKFEGDTVVAQALMFFAAGFETISTTVSFTLYEICLHKEIQDRLREEIRIVLSRHNQKLTYEALQEFKYMDMVINESMRKYPSLPFLDRICVEDYTIPNTKIVLKKGACVYIPLYALHMDPKFYPQPDKFDPERFSDKNSKGFAFLPFGGGPRSCIGSRFALIEMKLGLARILNEFELIKSENTPVPVEFEPKSILLNSKVGLPIRFKKI